MAIEKLPVELMTTSQIFQDITECWLYNDLHLAQGNYHSWKNPLFTLLYRPKLALHIRHIYVDYPRGNESFQPMDHVDTTETNIDSLDAFDFNQVPKNRGRSYNGDIGIFIGEAVRFPFVQQLMGTEWKATKTFPFMSLSDVNIIDPQTSFELVPMVLSMRYLQLDGYGWYGFANSSITTARIHGFLHPLATPTTPKFETLEVSVLLHMQPPELAKLISSPWLSSLKDLRVYNCGMEHSDREIFDLVHAVGRHLPILEQFEWTRSPTFPYGPDLLPQGHHFGGLKQLRRLTIDFDLFAPTSYDRLEQISYAYISEEVPEDLQHLSLINLSIEVAHSFITAFEELIAREGNAQDTTSEVLAQLARKTTAKTVSLCLCQDWAIDCKLTVMDVAVLSDVAEVFSQHGVEFKVISPAEQLVARPGQWVKEGVLEEGLLVGPGYMSHVLLDYVLFDWGQ
ncbi:hypothetical protein T440DRAFT_474271 [Plenodomus tracheiphilus IPT5]|uniref:Uncharacterized protein n=1 Tax=Plenodomus tracheiphilus IPT5 TaxID=1408161 RepID=A0A6A7BNA9_9PLEO|nr:hypothetical protein T440DRAFT_474271 [Plenodomus tracheiphilus IPT5]